MTTTDLPRYLAEWLAHLSQTPPGPVAIIAPSLRIIEVDVLRPIQDSRPGFITYHPGAQSADLLGRLAVLIATTSPGAETRLRGCVFVSALAVDLYQAPRGFWRELDNRLAPGARMLEISRELGGAR